MKMQTLVGSLALLGLASHALAQTAPQQRIVITGSSIKRIQNEGALPLQVITAGDMERSGIQNVEQLLRSLGTNASGADNATSNNNVFGADTDRLTGGSANANLRGLGPASTLVLLNGRRLASYGMSGAAVDLNAIPTAALARVEILKDGASAIYGTDAVGGVINFILKTDYQGVAIGLDYADPLERGGGTTRRVSLTAGFGALESQGWNVLGSISFDKNDILRGKDRDFSRGYNPQLGLSPNSSSHPVANVITAAGTALGTTGGRVGTDTTNYTRINPLALPSQPGCSAVETGVPFEVALWNRSGGATNANSRYLCNTDYGSQYMLAPPKEGYNAVLRGTLQLGSSHQVFAEAVASRTEVRAELVPTQFSTTAAAANHYPVAGPHYLNLANYGVTGFNATLPIAYRWRMQDFGNRVIDNVADNQRVLVGAEGDIGSYSYRVGLSRAQSRGWYDLVDGYAYSVKLKDALRTGVIDPWVLPGESQSTAAMALIESTKARGRVGGGETGLTQLDASLSGEVMQLPAGPLAFAVGTDLRRESFEFAMASNFTCVSTLATVVATDVLLCPGNSAVPKVSRNVAAVYAELAVPVFKGLDLQLALRHDRYSGKIGDSTNPKLALRYQPFEALLFRGSVNTGFRAPSFQQQSANIAPRDLTSQFNDPVRCPVDPTQCAIVGVDYIDSGNPDLTPEKSKQGSFGVVAVPMRGLTLFADYWQVRLEDRIRKLTVNDVIAGFTGAGLFGDRFDRDASGNVTLIRAGWINAADSTTKGIDWGATYDANWMGSTWRAKIDGTYLIDHRERVTEALPLVGYVGTFGARTLYLRNKFNAELGWSQGNWAATLVGNYKSGYADQDMSAKGTPPATTNTRVTSYTTYGLFATYSGLKGTTITAGLRNLLDEKPPFTHHDVDDVVGAGWDPRVADPFGRTFTLSVRYSF